MKQLVRCIGCALLAVVAAGVSAPVDATSTLTDQKADRVIQEFKAAAGRSSKTKFLTLVGEGGSQHDGAANDCPFWLRIAVPNQFQIIDRHLPRTNRPGGDPMVYTNNQGNGWLWEKSPQPYLPHLSPPRSMPANEAADIVGAREPLRFVLGLAPDWASESGLVTFTFNGPVVDGPKQLVELSVSDRNGQFAELRFDARTHLPDSLRYHFVGKVPSTVERTITMHYSDFRPASGLIVPFTFKRESETGVSSPTTRISRYAVNDGLKPAVFVRLPTGQVEASLPMRADIKW